MPKCGTPSEILEHQQTKDNRTASISSTTSSCAFAEASAVSAGMSQTNTTFTRWLDLACMDASKQHLIPLKAI